MRTTTSLDAFTNRYALSKTLRFELKPIGNTQMMLEQNNVFAKDRAIREKYEKTKPWIDLLHREFVAESLQNAQLGNLDDYYAALQNVQKITKDTNAEDKKRWKKGFEKQEKRLRKEVVALFDKAAHIWATQRYPQLKKKTKDFLFEEGVFEHVLFARYGSAPDTTVKIVTSNPETGEVIDEREESIFKGWKGFTGYFDKFFETRKNFYKDNGTATAIATRAINQNLRRFAENMQKLTDIKNNYPELLAHTDFGDFDIAHAQSLDFYARTCLLQEGIDAYNKKFVGVLKSAINEYQQKNKGVRISYPKTLDNQILGERERRLFDVIEDDRELHDVFRAFVDDGTVFAAEMRQLAQAFSAQNGTYDYTQIYISKKGFETISRKYTHDTRAWHDALADVFKAKAKKRIATTASGEKKFPAYIPVAYITQALTLVQESEDTECTWKERYASITENKTLEEGFFAIFADEFERLFVHMEATVQDTDYVVAEDKAKKLLSDGQITKNEQTTQIIKEYADALLRIYQMAKYFAVEKKSMWDDAVAIDDTFYETFKEIYGNTHSTIVASYNLLRNYLTKKPWEDVQKWKLNFENPTLLDGWDKNKEAANFGVILRDGDKFYLGIMRKGHNNIFANQHHSNFEGQGLQKMVYKFFPDPKKMFPKVCFSAKGMEFFAPSEEIVRIYKNAEFKSGDTFNVESMQKLIDFYKNALQKYDGWKIYDFKHLKDTAQYTSNIGEFYDDVAKGGYQLGWQNISKEYVEEKNANGELYLFQIKNKDWNDGATGRKNLHTLYFEYLFSEKNAAADFVFRLNGGAEVFYRPAAIESKTERRGNREVAAKKRYTQDKVFLHVPITLNRTAGDVKTSAFNDAVNRFLAGNPDINIMGIDRGEKHLAYYSIIDQNGNRIVSGSFNTIGSKDYHALLTERQGAREEARKNWQRVEQIKDLKKGYISLVVREIADLAIKHNAIIVLENLNMRFKQIRGGIEKSVYQQLEKALIEKLNFLVNKGEVDATKAGHLLRAYQLAAPFETFEKMGNQTGIIFYTTASYTSQVDPVTGWRPHVYLKYRNAQKTKEDILRIFDDIVFNDEKQRFEFAYRHNGVSWTVCSSVERHRWNRSNNAGKGGYDVFPVEGEGSITQRLQEACAQRGIDTTRNILAQIDELDESASATVSFLRDLCFYFRLICQIRNTDDGADDINAQDFLMSPVEPFFDTRNAQEQYPQNGDENGAYNIARKGIIILQKITAWGRSQDTQRRYPDTFVSQDEWDTFLTQHTT